MAILVPDDPVFMAKFLGIEEPLLHSLYYFHLNELGEAQANLVRAAYQSWGEVQLRLPPVLRWQDFAPAGSPQRQALPTGYTLLDWRGRRLTALYAVDASADHLSVLRDCHGMLALAQEQARGPLAEALALIDPAPGQQLVDDFRRVLEVMELKAPPSLLEALGHGLQNGPTTESITLDGTQQADYRELCDQLVSALSNDGDGFSYTAHRALYP